MGFAFVPRTPIHSVQMPVALLLVISVGGHRYFWKPSKAQPFRVFLNELGTLIWSQIFAQTRNTKRGIYSVQARSQLMCQVSAPRKSGAGGADAQARMG